MVERRETRRDAVQEEGDEIMTSAGPGAAPGEAPNERLEEYVDAELENEAPDEPTGVRPASGER